MDGLLTPADYTDPDRYQLEVDRVLGRSWLPLCRADQLPSPGDRFALTLLGRPVVAVRAETGEIGVFANVCPHRASMLVDDGAGTGSTIICPYHRWAFRLDGSFIGAPLADGVDLTDVCLTPVRHTLWQGFVLVDLSGDAPTVGQALAGLDRHLAPWSWSELVTVGSASFESTWNWKVMVENWIECYHHVGTHRESVEPYQPARATRLVDPDGPWAAMTVDSTEGVGGPPENWIPTIDEWWSRKLSVWAAFPLLLGGSLARHAFWLHVVPTAVDRHRVTWYLLAHRDHVGRYTPELVDEELALLSHVHREDMEACRRVQAGLASGFFAGPRLVPLERPIADFHHWLGAFALDADQG